jgi:hypothetical protein
MSKHNYTQYSNNKKQNKHERVATVLDTTSEVKMEVETEPVYETIETVTLPNMVEGTVVNCAKLNVREQPSTDADILCVLSAMSEIEIDVNKSTRDWFYVCTAIGVEGYCMQMYVDARL